MYDIQKNSVRIEKAILTYRIVGNGPLMILLHPSPRTGALMQPLMQLLAPNFTVIAPDTPGYGESQPPALPLVTMDEYTYFIEALRIHANVDTIYLYGSASGAQLAIAYALRYPKNITRLFLDNAAHFEDSLGNEILQHYFIDINPETNQQYNKQLYDHVKASCLFFPWYDQSPENQIAKELPPDSVIDSIVNDYKTAGPNYAIVYRAAFLHERANKVQALVVPTIIFRWKGSPILKYIDALLKYKLPHNMQVIETSPAIVNRYEQMKEIMIATL